MTREQKQENTFWVVKWFAKHYYSEKKVHYYKEELLRNTSGTGLEDANCLIRMAFKEIDEHNSKLNTKISLLENLKYSPKYLQSSLFSGISIPFRKIETLIDENPDKQTYEIFRMLIH